MIARYQVELWLFFQIGQNVVMLMLSIMVLTLNLSSGGIMLYTDNNYNTYYKSPQDQIDFDSYMGESLIISL